MYMLTDGAVDDQSTSREMDIHLPPGAKVLLTLQQWSEEEHPNVRMYLLDVSRIKIEMPED